jgi:hypothetical protein
MAPLKSAKDILVHSILGRLRSYPVRVTETGARKPVIFGLQGPQGIGRGVYVVFSFLIKIKEEQMKLGMGW